MDREYLFGCAVDLCFLIQDRQAARLMRQDALSWRMGGYKMPTWEGPIGDIQVISHRALTA